MPLAMNKLSNPPDACADQGNELAVRINRGERDDRYGGARRLDRKPLRVKTTEKLCAIALLIVLLPAPPTLAHIAEKVRGVDVVVLLSSAGQFISTEIGLSSIAMLLLVCTWRRLAVRSKRHRSKEAELITADHIRLAVAHNAARTGSKPPRQ